MAGLDDGMTHFVKVGLSRVKIQVSLRGRKEGVKIDYFVGRRTSIHWIWSNEHLFDQNEEGVTRFPRTSVHCLSAKITEDLLLWPTGNQLELHLPRMVEITLLFILTVFYPQ